jgi:hypothetical protein
MSENWTKGPWNFEADKEDDIVYVCHPETNSPDTTVCMFEVDGPEVIVNAHLIAAAPEMYAAIKTNCAFCDYQGDCGECAFAEVLKKARGEA